MRVADLIELLKDWQNKYGPDAQISVPEMGTGVDREEIYIHNEPVATVLTSRGDEVIY